jgi:7,8-dihydroneopterin aldolase/epimerase/oxygenase
MQALYKASDFLVSTIDDMIVEVRCGLHPWERHPERPNRLRISVKMFAKLASGPSANTPIIDYDPIRNFVLSLQTRGHIDLLETIVDEVTAVCFSDLRVEACQVSVRKPDIFAEAAGAGIDVFRTREGWSP